MKYIKKAVIIDAIQVKANNFDRICDFMGCTPEQVLNPMSGIGAGGDGHVLDRRRERDVRVPRRPQGDGDVCRHRGNGETLYNNRL